MTAVVIDAASIWPKRPPKRRDPTLSDDLRNRLSTLLRKRQAAFRASLSAAIEAGEVLSSDLMRVLAMEAFAGADAEIAAIERAAQTRGRATAFRELGLKPSFAARPSEARAAAQYAVARILAETAVELARTAQATTRARTRWSAFLRLLKVRMGHRLMATVNVLVSSAFNAGKLEVYGEAGIREVGVEVEADHVTVKTAGDARVCEECRTLEGRPFTVQEARGMLPIHPSCRCALVPYV